MLDFSEYNATFDLNLSQEEFDKIMSNPITEEDILSGKIDSLTLCDGNGFKQEFVAIVRCKECKFRIKDSFRGREVWTCELDSADPYESSRYAEDDEWFCADGERRLSDDHRFEKKRDRP